MYNTDQPFYPYRALRSAGSQHLLSDGYHPAEMIAVMRHETAHAVDHALGKHFRKMYAVFNAASRDPHPRRCH